MRCQNIVKPITPHTKEKSPIKPPQKKNKPKTKETHVQVVEENPKKTEANIMMGPSSSSDIRLGRQFMPATESEKEEMTFLKNKLSLTSTQKQLYELPKNTTLKFHYINADMLLEDYHQHIMKFQNMKEKPSSQYILDIKQVWMSVDKSLSTSKHLKIL